jgi:hypothetical protein
MSQLRQSSSRQSRTSTLFQVLPHSWVDTDWRFARHHVEWTDDATEAQVSGLGQIAVPTAAPFTGSLIAPPPQEIEALLHLARLGDMRAIVQHAARLIELDERYRPFADHLCRLARAYQSKAIVLFVEQYPGRSQVQ